MNFMLATEFLFIACCGLRVAWTYATHMSLLFLALLLSAEALEAFNIDLFYFVGISDISSLPSKIIVSVRKYNFNQELS